MLTVIIVLILVLIVAWLLYLTIRHQDVRQDVGTLADAIVTDSKAEAKRLTAKVREKL